MNLKEAFGLQRGDCISLVGGGGKTSLLYALAEENPFNHILCSTSTKMMDPRISGQICGGACRHSKGHPFHRILIPWKNSYLPSPRGRGDVCFVAREQNPCKPGSVHGLLPEQFSFSENDISWPLIVVEADGAARLPLKAPGSHEPVLPERTSLLVGCIGLDVLGKSLTAQWVHRPGIFSELTGLVRDGEPINLKHLAALINHKEGLFKSCPRDARCCVFLNKMDILGSFDDVRADIHGLMEELSSLLHPRISRNVKILAASLARGQLLGLN